VDRSWQRTWDEGYANAMAAAAGREHWDRDRSLEWRTDVVDPTGRPRAVVVTSANGRVSVAPPPGEGFSMTPDQADVLALAIRAASSHAQRR
jgi:hypothetical protein